MLCETCEALPIQGFDPSWAIPHYATFTELDESSKNGCNLCTLFKAATLDYYAEKLACSVEEADIYHRYLDKLVLRAHNSGDKQLSHEDREEKGTDYGNEMDDSEDEESDEDFASSFFVKAGFVTIDSTFVDLSRGLHSLEYVRQADDHELAITVKEVFPAVHISCLEDSVPLLDWDIVGRPVPVMAEYALAKSWIKECVAEHTQCSPNSQSPLPTRVLDLGRSRTDMDIRLAVNLADKEPYATLSHCWGSSRPLRLTLANYDQLQTGITYASLPKTFQDAVTVTRALGLRYLWIDSLCIIQDSKDDWEEQCTKMSLIYGNSFITIAGPAAPDSDSGFIYPRKSLGQTTLEITDEEESGRVTISHYGVSELAYDLMPEPDSPLAQRGWVLQERLLSQRILYFGSSNMYFECFTNVRFDSCHYPVLWDYQSVSMATKKLISQLEDANERFQYWLHNIETYGDTRLTKFEDKLPAISALAAEFHQATGWRYLAGVWQEDLHRMLTWYISYYHWKESPPMPIPQEYIAPSWSWASAKHHFTFPNKNYEMQLHADMEIIKAETTPSGLDPFGTVMNGHIWIRGKLRHAVIKTARSRWVPTREVLHINSESSALELLGMCHPDDGRTMISPGTRLLLLYLGAFDGRDAVALAIECCESREDTFKRVGFARTEDKAVRENLIGYFGDAERKEILLY